MTKLTLICLFSSLLWIASTDAKIIQILHTNDVHSHFEFSYGDKDRGGYARLKSMIDAYKEAAKENGIPTVVVDAGDFLEGHIFYMADKARHAFQLMDDMGYDLVTMGNHDYLMGARSFNSILMEGNLKTPMLAANVLTNPLYWGIKRKIRPYKTLNVDGIPITFLGLTTNELFYKWRYNAGKILSPLKVGRKYDRKFIKKNHPYVIALTHLGLKKDKKLVRKTKGIDLVIGGHSHHALHRPIWQRNQHNKKIAIVQAGSHGGHLGRLLLELKGGEVKIVNYELIPVKGIEKDNHIHEKVKSAREDLEDLYGKEYLNEVVGHLNFPKERPDYEWNMFVTNSMVEAVNADAAVHAVPMSGVMVPSGAVTRFDIMNGHPRFFELDETNGWSIYKARVNGWLLKSILKVILQYEVPLSFSGVTFKWRKTRKGYKITRIRLNGKKISPYKTYTMAFPEGVIRGAHGISSLTKLIIRRAKNTKVSIFDAIEKKLRREKDFGFLGLENIPSKERPGMYFPGVSR